MLLRYSPKVDQQGGVILAPSLWQHQHTKTEGTNNPLHKLDSTKTRVWDGVSNSDLVVEVVLFLVTQQLQTGQPTDQKLGKMISTHQWGVRWLFWLKFSKDSKKLCQSVRSQPRAKKHLSVASIWASLGYTIVSELAPLFQERQGKISLGPPNVVGFRD